MPRTPKNLAASGISTPPAQGRKPPTTTDIAALAGVSRATVSFVLNRTEGTNISPATRERVLSAAAQLGYTAHAVATSLRSGKSKLILVPSFSFPSGPLVTWYTEHLSANLAQAGYSTLVPLDRHLTGMDAARFWSTFRPAGMLVDAQRLTDEAVGLLRHTGTQAIIAFGFNPALSSVPSFDFSERRIGEVAGAYLQARGHRRIAIVMPDIPTLLPPFAIPRAEGIEEVAQQHGLRTERLTLAYGEAHATALARQWRAEGAPDAVFGYNDDYAALIMRALLDEGFSIPQDIAVMGVDHLPVAGLMRPRLTSVVRTTEEVEDVGAALVAPLLQPFQEQPQGVRLDLHLQVSVAAGESC